MNAPAEIAADVAETVRVLVVREVWETVIVAPVAATTV
jgi:hypothetical protein